MAVQLFYFDDLSRHNISDRRDPLTIYNLSLCQTMPIQV